MVAYFSVQSVIDCMCTAAAWMHVSEIKTSKSDGVAFEFIPPYSIAAAASISI